MRARRTAGLCCLPGWPLVSSRRHRALERFPGVLLLLGTDTAPAAVPPWSLQTPRMLCGPGEEAGGDRGGRRGWGARGAQCPAAAGAPREPLSCPQMPLRVTLSPSASSHCTDRVLSSSLLLWSPSCWEQRGEPAPRFAGRAVAALALVAGGTGRWVPPGSLLEGTQAAWGRCWGALGSGNAAARQLCCFLPLNAVLVPPLAPQKQGWGQPRWCKPGTTSARAA